MSNKGGTYRKPSIVRRRPPMTAARAAYLMQTATARMNTGRECPECFTFGFHSSNCSKGE